MQKNAIILLSLLLLSLTAMAIPAKRVQKWITLADGTQKCVTLRGDEAHHFYESEEGERYRELADGSFVAMLANEEAVLIEKANLRRAKLNSRRTNRMMVKRQAGNATSGQKRGLVILVNFADTKFKATSTVAAFYEMLNLKGYSKNGHIGSARDYFLDQSNGKLDIHFDVVGPVTMPNQMSYYGKDSGGEGNDAYAGTMVIEACKKVDDQINFADYDWDGDGEVDQVYVIYAGYNQAQGAPSNTIWPHEWTLDEAADFGDGSGRQKFDGVWVNTYACSSELKGTSGSTIDGIGTLCHEFSHCLGLPDLYDTNYVAFGMDQWSLMDSGSYNSNGNIPAAYTAYERMYAGWYQPIELDSPATILNMRAITDGVPEGYIIYNKAVPTEFYILQNVQQKSWNTGAPGHGLLIMHVDYDPGIWEKNIVNNVSARQRCTIFHADNKAGTILSDLEGDPYPGTSRKQSFTPETTPAAKLYNAGPDGTKLMRHAITSIKESDGMVSFLFDGGEASGVENIASPESTIPTATYDIYGRALHSKALRGIMIEAGKKILY